MNPIHPRRSAFTLVELLVVLVIISMLMSLLLPILGKAVESARRVQCMNQMKQMAVALRLYADENGRMYPLGGYYANSGISRWSWDFGQTTIYTRLTQLLDMNTETKNSVKRRHEGYLPDVKILFCPSSLDNIPAMAESTYDAHDYNQLTDPMHSHFLKIVTYFYWGNEVGTNPKGPYRPHPCGPTDAKYLNAPLITDVVTELRVPWTSHMDSGGGGGNVLHNDGGVKWFGRSRFSGGPSVRWTSAYGFVASHWGEAWDPQ